MVLSRRVLFAAAAALLAVGVGAFAFNARAQTAPSERVIGYSVYAHSHYVLLQRADGSLRGCTQERQTALRRSPEWTCRALGALPPT